MRNTFVLCIALLITVFCSSSFAAYPEKPITMVVAYSAGGSTDLLARITAKYLEQKLKTPVVVVNKTGANGSIGFGTIAKAKPDGYTIGLVNLDVVVQQPIAFPQETRYKITDFDGLANVVFDPGVLVVNSSSPYENLNDLLAAAKKDPGKITMSHEGVGSMHYLAAQEIMNKAGVEFTLVPFEGDAPARAALLGGHIDVIGGHVSEVVEYVKNGQMRVLAVQSEKRSPDLPDVPTFTEFGMPTVIQSNSRRGFAAPKNIPQQDLELLRKSLSEIVEDPSYVAELQKLKMPIEYISGPDFTALLLGQDKVWAEIWKESPWIKK